MYKNFKYLLAVLMIASVAMLEGCKKEDALTIPEEQAHFTGTLGNYFVPNDPTSTFKVAVGLTTPMNVSRTVNFTVTSPTGAVAGQQYTLASNSVTIPAGQTLDSIAIKGLFAGYPAGRKDTLVITLAGGDVPIADFNKTYKVVLQRYCQVSLSNFTGNYTRAFDIQTGQPTYGPYNASMSNPVSTSATKGTIRVDNFWDVGTFITAELDWTDPSNFKLTIPTQFLYNDGTYGAATIRQVGNGSFSSCDNTFTFSYTVTVAAGSFGNFTTTIAR